MKIFLKGSNLFIRDIIEGVRYYFFLGIGRGIVFIRYGLFGVSF